MDFVNAVFIFILVWWTVIFAVLPFGNKAADKPVIGHASGAPANPNMKKKIIWTTGISLILTAMIMLLFKYSGFSLHDMVMKHGQY